MLHAGSQAPPGATDNQHLSINDLKPIPIYVAQQRFSQPGRIIIQTAACPSAMRRTHSPWSFSDFTVIKMLGEGQMSSVVQCLCNQSGAVVAIKMYHKDRMNSLNIKQVAREIEIHSALQHPSIIQLYAAFEDKDGIYLVEEFASKGDLFGDLSRKGGYMQEGHVVKTVLLPFLNALSYMHEQGVLHRDIKPENILLGDDGQIRVGDFGLAINALKERPVSRVGTLDYMPPEIVSLPLPNQMSPSKVDPNKPSSYGLPVDVWCVGILAYELLIGGPPFEADSREETYTRIMKTQPHLPSHLSEHAKDFVSQCLRKEPLQRPSILQLLRHPWIKTYQSLRFKSSSQLTSLGGGSPILVAAAPSVLPAKPPVVSSQGVMHSAASAPCLAPLGSSLSFGPTSARFAPKGFSRAGPPTRAPAAGSPVVRAADTTGASAVSGTGGMQRNPKYNSFVSLSSLMGGSPRPGLLSPAPSRTVSAANSPAVSTTIASDPHAFIAVHIDALPSVDEGDGDGIAAVPARHTAELATPVKPKQEGNGAEISGRASSKRVIRVGAGLLSDGEQAEPAELDIDTPVERQHGTAGTQDQLIQASHAYGQPSTVASPSASKSSPGGSKSRLGTGSPSQVLSADAVKGSSESTQRGSDVSTLAAGAGVKTEAERSPKHPGKVVNAVTGPTVAQLLSPPPGQKTARASLEGFLSSLGSIFSKRSSVTAPTTRRHTASPSCLRGLGEE